MPTDWTGHAEQEAAVMLRERLAAALPMTGIVMDRLTEALEGVRRELLSVSGKPILDLLLSQSTEVAVLQTIKGYGKKLAATHVERDIGFTIYFAAIASALVFHGQKITTHSHDTLARSFAVLAAKPWMVSELAALFVRGRECCQTQQA